MPEVYDRLLGPAFFHPFAVEVARRSAGLASRDVLELAAGTGVATRELVAALPDASVTATDLNRAMVAWGAHAVPQARWAVADAQRLPFVPGRFDLVVCQFGVMFFPDRPAAFAQARRVLRRAGGCCSPPGTRSSGTASGAPCSPGCTTPSPPTRRCSW